MGVRPANAEMIAHAVPAPLADDLVISIELAQADLEAAVETKALRHDPYRAILVGLSMSLGVFGKAITRWDSAVADVIASRDPLPVEERAALVHELVAATKQGAFEGMRKEAARMVRTLDRGLAVRIGVAVGGAFAAGVLATVATFLLLGVGPFSREARGASVWHDIAQNNPDPRQMLGAAEVRTDKASGRRYYAGVSLWLDPVAPPPKTGIPP